MTEQHPIAPPAALFKQWEDDILNERDNVDHVLDCAWRDGFRAGADQELEACYKWLRNQTVGGNTADVLKKIRRPKPPSLKEQALKELRVIHETFAHQGLGNKTPALDAALKRLGELEALDD
jgi:hypothetical protein